MFRTTKFSMSEQFQTLPILTLPFFQYLDSWQKYSISFEIKVVFKLFCGEMKKRYISLITFKDSSASQLMILLQLKNYIHIMLIFSYLSSINNNLCFVPVRSFQNISLTCCTVFQQSAKNTITKRTVDVKFIFKHGDDNCSVLCINLF